MKCFQCKAVRAELAVIFNNLALCVCSACYENYAQQLGKRQIIRFKKREG